MIDKEDLVAAGLCSPEVAMRWTPALNETMERFDISNKYRIAAFLAQVAHESGGFKFVVENLNYSADALLRVFPKYFPTPEIANEYARQPERIANRAYANRMGNGDEASGDGWAYRGRGLIQLTGKNNYASFSLQMDNNCLVEPDIVAEPKLAALSAGWYWNSRNINPVADTDDIKEVTRLVNGGYNGLADRDAKYEKLMQIL